MFFENKNVCTLEQKIAKNEKAMQELLIQLAAIDRKNHELYNDLNITPEKLSAFLANPSNFKPEAWAMMQSERGKLDEKLKRDLNNIRDPAKAKKTYAERNVGQHWLFVR